MAGGKGGSTTSTIEVPEYIEEAARRNLAKAEGISQIGFTPYYGPDVAAFTPFQQAGFQQTADVAGAFGMATPTSQRDIMGGMGAPTQYANGVMGYSSAPLYEQSLAELERRRPAQKAYIDSFFIDPVTGQAGSRVQPAIDYSQYMTSAEERERQRQNELAIAQAEASAGQYTGPMTMSPNGSQPERDAAMQFHATNMGRGSDNWQTVDEMMFQQGKINAAGFPIDAQGKVIDAGSFGDVLGDLGGFLTGGAFIGAAGRELGLLPSTDDRIMEAAGMSARDRDDPIFDNRIHGTTPLTAISKVTGKSWKDPDGSSAPTGGRASSAPPRRPSSSSSRSSSGSRAPKQYKMSADGKSGIAI